ncbi:MAG: zinc-binding protein [Chloroflexi bacterium]|nr:MAG: zinc-binding protein [Chloroflexota bacterium]RLC97110.1 MAG: zinc-binding protein [Chloroflexota bacterium]
MGYVDKTLQCSDCGASFTFSADEQELFASRGYTNEPKRCSLCRASRRSRNGSMSGYRPSRQMFPAVCAECGKETEVPFEPREGRPVYCSRCYDKVRVTRRY